MNYDTEKYKAWKLPNVMLVHWILNPGLAFNEIILGQRIPKVTLIDKTKDAPLLQRQYIPCPTCGEINDGRLWSKGNSFGHWFGLICPKCGNKIPCLWTLTSIIILALTFPIWFFIKKYFEKSWHDREMSRFKVIDPEAATVKKTSWVKMGFNYGLLMFCFMSLPKILKNHLSIQQTALQAAIWLGAGLFFGVTMWFFMGRKK